MCCLIFKQGEFSFNTLFYLTIKQSFDKTVETFRLFYWNYGYNENGKKETFGSVILKDKILGITSEWDVIFNPTRLGMN